MEDFNTKWAIRTKQLAIDMIKFYGKLPKSDETRIIGKQLIRSATSTAANFRGRSTRE
jgi:four helix bundle protein